MSERPPKENLVRAMRPGSGIEYRDASTDGSGTLSGHFSVFDAWYEVDSMWEGHFLERVAPGAFKKTFAENRDHIKVTFNHGMDPTMGDQVLGQIARLEEDRVGAAYEVPLFEGIPPLIMAGLRGNAYGASFRFRVITDEFDKRAKVSDYNPKGLPERTIKEAAVAEFGPVTFPASASATAAVRSMTDEYVMGRVKAERTPMAPMQCPMPSDSELPGHLGESAPAGHGMEGYLGDAQTQHAALHGQGVTHHIHPEAAPAANALPKPGAEPAHSEDESRDTVTPPVAAPSPNRSRNVNEYRSRDEMVTRQKELQGELNVLITEFPGTMPEDRQAEFDVKASELTDLSAALEKAEARARFMAVNTTEEHVDAVVQPTWQAPRVNQNRTDDVVVRDIYDFAEIRGRSRNPEHEVQLLRSSALRAIDGAELVHTPYASREKCGDALDELIRQDDSGETSRRILSTGAPAYRRFFHKMILGGIPTADEQRAAALTGLGATTTTGGFATVYELDATIMPTSNGTVNPYRSISKVVKTNANEWRAVTSTGTTAVMAGEATAVAEGGPTLAQPAAIVQKAHGEVTFSIEAGEDIANLDNQLGAMFVDAKDILECQKFTTGAGTTIFPQGIVIGAAASTTATATTTVIAAADLYTIEAALAPRFRTNATWVMNRFITNKIRAIDTAGGAQLYTPNLTVGLNNYNGPSSPVQYNLLGYPVAECSEMPASVATTVLEAVFGDFGRYFAIIDKIGMNVELVPLFLDATTGFPTGQRALYFYWRFTSKVLSASAFQIMKGA
jgi:HK97 family phage major capsid protein/HK97 family phage prohead protease